MTNPAPSHLLNLPNELLFIIAEHLPVPDLNSFLQTNRHLAAMLTPLLHQSAVTDLDGCPALLWALGTAHEQLVRLLLEKGVDANSQRNGVTALLYAVIRLREPIMRMLIDEGSDGVRDAVVRLGESIFGLLSASRGGTPAGKAGLGCRQGVGLERVQVAQCA
ncbi:uncharacterized protein LAJ45_04846 [Morchella importuna]|uniref:uncharacterized protein n=1 Tax=Morchella importuna TaxID=1174673 RepID=UPI001E8D540B|nr:uncharacterized protein LAJ45_04846 [Morchella importuna]KAH8151144.1 hypothetical protein LAJ45_04846 [Morchella importuna]